MHMYSHHMAFTSAVNSFHKICTSGSFPLRSKFKCHLMRETFSNYPIYFFSYLLSLKYLILVFLYFPLPIKNYLFNLFACLMPDIPHVTRIKVPWDALPILGVTLTPKSESSTLEAFNKYLLCWWSPYIEAQHWSKDSDTGMKMLGFKSLSTTHSCVTLGKSLNLSIP